MRQAKRTNRSAATVVEFAITAPVLLLLIFASWDFSRACMLAQTATNAAYEGCRRGIVPGATSNDVRTRANAILDASFVRLSTITVTPAQITSTTERLTVTVDLPINGNSWVTSWFLADKTISSTFTLRRERIEVVTVP